MIINVEDDSDYEDAINDHWQSNKQNHNDNYKQLDKEHQHQFGRLK